MIKLLNNQNKSFKTLFVLRQEMPDFDWRELYIPLNRSRKLTA